MVNTFETKKRKNINLVFPVNGSDVKEKRERWSSTALVVIHLHYPELFEVFLPYIKNIPHEFDVIITTSNKAMQDLLDANEYIQENDIKVIFKTNRGRDISSFLVAARKEILKYEYFCFVHDKKEKASKMKHDIDTWVQEMWESMLGSHSYIWNIIDYLEKHREVGVLAPPFPIYFQHVNIFRKTWGDNYENTVKLLNDFHVVADVDRAEKPATFGTVFWARTDSLRKLLSKEWCYEDFDAEPLPDDGTLSHSIERSFSFFAEDAGYETGWVMTDRLASKREEAMSYLIQNCYSLIYDELGLVNPQQMLEYQKIKKEIRKIAKESVKVYIYGAGVYGCGCLRIFENLGLNVAGFIVSKYDSDRREMKGLPIFEISDIEWTDQIGVVIAVNLTLQEEVISNILKLHPDFDNYICI